jgi:hypothetical protein
MHRFILGLATGDPRIAHHRNEVKLDNRRANLETFANASEHGLASHPTKDATIREKCQALASQPGWPFNHHEERAAMEHHQPARYLAGTTGRREP